MTIAVDLGRKAAKTNKTLRYEAAKNENGFITCEAPLVLINPNFEPIIVKIFLTIYFLINFGCSIEFSQ